MRLLKSMNIYIHKHSYRVNDRLQYLIMDDFMHINYAAFFTFVDQFNTLTTSTTVEILLRNLKHKNHIKQATDINEWLKH